MLWLALYFPQLPLEVYGQEGLAADLPVLVSRKQGGKEVVDRCNAMASGFGIVPGMALASALALCAGLQVRARDGQLEHRALQSLAAWAYQFSSRITFEPLALLLEVGGSLRLFGGCDSLCARVRHELAEIGYLVQMALAPTPGAAGLLARLGSTAQVQDVSSLPDALSRIPLRSVTRNLKARALIQSIGLSSIGDCLRLPRAELSRRLEPGLMLLLDRILGFVPDPRPTWQPPSMFQDRLELMAEVSQAQALLFPAQRLVALLCGFLRGHDGAAQRLDWCFQHQDMPPTCITQGLLKPSRDAARIIGLLRERLDRLELPAPVREISLSVRDWQSARESTAPLFEDSPEPADAGFLDALCARLGVQAVRGLQALPDYRPEKSWCYRDPTGAVDQTQVRQAPGPTWLLPQPKPLPQGRAGLMLEAHPERLESGWWDGEDMRRDYYQARDHSGRRLWVFQDLRDGHWYLQGLFD